MQNQYKNITEHPLFNHLTVVEKKLLLDNMSHESALPKEFLYKDDCRIKHIYFISKGTIILGKNLGRSNEFTHQLTMKPLFLGIESLILMNGNHQFAKTATKVSYSKISKELFYKILLSNPQFHQTIREQLIDSLCNFEKKYSILHSKTEIPERIKLFLLELIITGNQTSNHSQKIILHMTHLEISKYLQCARQSVSLYLSKLKAEGIINYGRNYFEVLDIEKLKKCKLYIRI